MASSTLRTSARRITPPPAASRRCLKSHCRFTHENPRSLQRGFLVTAQFSTDLTPTIIAVKVVPYRHVKSTFSRCRTRLPGKEPVPSPHFGGRLGWGRVPTKVLPICPVVQDRAGKIVCPEGRFTLTQPSPIKGRGYTCSPSQAEFGSGLYVDEESSSTAGPDSGSAKRAPKTKLTLRFCL